MHAEQKTLLLLKPRGFCAGVVRAIDIVRIALDASARRFTSAKKLSTTATLSKS
jgi:4-hydroxy-3-methylbut-2-enyl diphosphate reductase IspH